MIFSLSNFVVISGFVSNRFFSSYKEGANNTVYSRKTFPPNQVTLIKKSRIGSFKGW